MADTLRDIIDEELSSSDIPQIKTCLRRLAGRLDLCERHADDSQDHIRRSINDLRDDVGKLQTKVFLTIVKDEDKI